MLRSKTRTLSASKLCRGDVIRTQIDAKALKVKSIDKKPSKNRADRIMAMQLQIGEMEDELRSTKDECNVSEIEKCRILDQLKDAKELAQEANNELKMELQRLKTSLGSSRDELNAKDRKIDSLESELLKPRQLEADKLNEELIDLKEREQDTVVLLHENKKRIQELEEELARRKELESKIVDTLALRTKELDTTKFELEESKFQIISLHEKIESLEEKFSTRHSSSRFSSQENGFLSGEEIHQFKNEMDVLKNERRLAIEAEEKSTKAMEDLALALKEVATESNQAKEKLRIAHIELEHVRAESEQLREVVRNTEEMYQNLLREAKQEAELHKNTADRLRLEAEETLLALNGKEMGFVTCIKRAEEERAIVQHENLKLTESLKSSENMMRAAREETYKLRDILKQAVNEANASKAAASIARDENSLLKDSLAEKDERLHFLSKENERLRMSEAAANENVKQLKILLSRGCSMEFKNEECNKELVDKEEENEKVKNNMVRKSFSFNLEDLKFMNEPEDKVLDEDPTKADALKGSIFDTNADTPKSEPHTPKTALSNRQRGCLEDGRVKRNSEDFDHLDDSDLDKGYHRRVKTMFQRVGDLLTIRRSLHRKEASVEQMISTHGGLH
ncbi:hypothetical protein OROHE_015426 [Orobanche hederae]